MSYWKKFFQEQIAFAGRVYVNDLEAMTDDQLNSSPGGKARTPYDISWEVAHVNNRLATRIRGEDPGPSTIKGYITCPEEGRDKQTIIARVQASTDNLLRALEMMDENRLTETAAGLSGDDTNASMLALAAVHMMYHDAQLNYVQAMNGDEAMHWD